MVGWLCFLNAVLIGVVPVTTVSMKFLISVRDSSICLLPEGHPLYLIFDDSVCTNLSILNLLLRSNRSMRLLLPLIVRCIIFVHGMGWFFWLIEFFAGFNLIKFV